MREGVNDGERAFYRMIVNASLDILSRSLRSKSFYRVVVFILLLQMVLCFFLKSVLEHALESGRKGGGLSFWQYLWLGIVSVMGYWVVNVLIRVLGYLACGGVTAWFAQQSSMMEDMETMRRREMEEIDADVGRGGTGLEGGHLDVESMPEAYRAVDASAYSLGIEFDEGMDDDYGDEDGILMDSTDSNGHGGGGQNGSRSSTWGPSSNNTSTVKAFLKSAFGVSFGSIVHCALLGGVASCTWSMLNTIDWIMSSSLRLAPFRLGTFRGMRVGDDSDDNGSMSDRLLVKWQRAISLSRAFVRNHNDLALCHVAAYYKSYTRAANDVMVLVNTSGIEPIIHENISVHMCSSISKSISGLVVIFVGQSLATSNTDHMTICEIMVITFIMCYTITLTMMEPLQASIKAVYICFAQNQQSLSQAFPLLYNRLDRLSREQGSNMV